MSTALQELQDAQGWLSRAEHEAGTAETMPALARAHQACAIASEAVAAAHRALVKEYAIMGKKHDD